MIRLLFFVIAIIAASLGLAWLAERPGTVTVEWFGYQVEASALTGALAVAGIVVVLIAIWSVLRFLLTRPAAIAAGMRERKRRQGFDALTQGLLAVGVGDRELAGRYAGLARRQLPNEPLTALLRAQAAQLGGDRAAARRAFEAMLDRPETELLGLRGLFLEASRRNDPDAARQFVEQAVKRDPQLGWSVNALFELQARAGDWQGALDTLAIARQHGHVTPDIALRRRAVLLTAEAGELERAKPDRALALATEALKLAPSLVPAAQIAGRILSSKGENRLASRLIVRTWKLSPHPDLARGYAFAKPGEAPRERLKRVKYLASLTPGEIEGPIAVAIAAIEAHAWQDAREALAPYLETRPPARVCALMARIEAGEFGDKGREREWLARAVRAPRDRAWIANGYISDRWLPLSPVTGAVDAFEWKAPVDAIGRGDATLMIEERIEAAGADPRLSHVELPPAATEVAALEAIESAPSAGAEVKDPGEAHPAEGQSAASPNATPPRPAETKPKLQIFVAPPPPDDPGVQTTEREESPTSLERLRTAQFR